MNRSQGGAMRRIYLLLSLFLLAILFLPGILSTPWGNKLVTGIINRSISGMVTADSIELSWFSGVEAHQLKFFDSDGEPLLTADAIAVDLSWSDLLLHRYTPIKVGTLTNVNTTVIVDEKGNNNFNNALSRQGETLHNSLTSIVIESLSATWNWPATFSCSGRVNGAAIKSDLEMHEPTHFDVTVDQLPLEVVDWLITSRGYTTGNVLQLLLGSTLSLRVNDHELVIMSQRLKGHSKWETTATGLTLTAPAQLMYNARQETLEALAPHFPIALAEAATINIDINKWVIPFRSWSDSSFAVEASINGSRWLLETVETSFSVPHLSVTVEKEEVLLVTAQMDAYEEAGDSKIELAARWGGAHWSIDLETDAFPITAIDKISGSQMQLTRWLGETLDLKIHGKTGERLIIKACSPYLNLPNAHFDVGETLTLSSPVSASWSLPMVSLYNITIDEPSTIGFNIKELCLPLQYDHLWQHGMINATVNSRAAMALQMGRGRVILESGELAITGPSLSQANCELHCMLKNESETIADVLGQESSCSLLAKLSPTSSDFRLQLIGDQSLLQCKGRYANGVFELLSPAQVAFTMTPKLLQHLQFNEANGLMAPAHVELTVAPFSAKGVIEEWKLSGTAQIKGMTVAAGRQRDALNALFASWDYSRNKWNVHVNGATEREGVIQGSFSYKHPSSYKGSVQLTHFPTALLAMHRRLNQLPQLLGATVNATASLELTNDSGPFSLNIASEALNCITEGVVSNGVIKTTTASTLQMCITPERFNALYRLMGVDTPLKLRDSASLELTIQELETPWERLGRNCRLHASGSIAPLSITHQDETLTFKRIDGTLHSQFLGQMSTFNIVGTSDNNSETLVLSGTVEDLLTYDDNFNRKSLSLALETRITNGSAPLFGALLFPQFPLLPTQLKALVGTPFDLNFDTQLKNMHGRVVFSLKGGQGNAAFAGKLIGDHLLLEAPAVAEVTATPLLGRAVFNEVFPLFTGMQSSEHPIKITIDPDGFSLPIDRLKLAEADMKHCTIEIGKVNLSHAGPLKTILGLIGAPNNSELSLWATPLYLNLQQGKLTIERVDILVDHHYPIACWGTVDFPRDQTSLIIGIHTPALANALNINKLPPHQILQVPLTGSIENPSIDKSKVAARISALVAQAEDGGGVLLGTVLNIASGAFDEEPPPPPTTSPLPWDEEPPIPAPKKERKRNAELIKKGAKTMLKKTLALVSSLINSLNKFGRFFRLLAHTDLANFSKFTSI